MHRGGRGVEIWIKGRLWRRVRARPFAPLLKEAGSASSLQELYQLFEHHEPRLARIAAAELLSRQALTQQALEKRLTDRGFLREIALETAELYVREGFVNDAAWAESFIERRLSQGYGRRHIAQELSMKGLDWPVGLEIDEKSCLKRLIEKRYSSFKDHKERSKAITSLSRRGFSLQQILDLLPA